MSEASDESDDVEGGSGGRTQDWTWADVQMLPPMPKPDRCNQRCEAGCGNTLVLFLIFIFVVPMQLSANVAGEEITNVMRLQLGLIYLEAVIALVCLFGLMWGDPGTIKRSPRTCFPQPSVVADKLRCGESLAMLGNIDTGDRTFCTRCLVWRDNEVETHHCATCQRCVTDFDHHCGVRTCICPCHAPASGAFRAWLQHLRAQPYSLPVQRLQRRYFL